MKEETLLVKNLTKGKLSSLPFVLMKNTILGSEYELSVVCVGEKLARKLNRDMRAKDYATNILSFSLSKTSGEIIFQLDCVKKDAKNFNMSYKEFLKFLFIHGLLHLKGMDHGLLMEKEEKKYLKLF